MDDITNKLLRECSISLAVPLSHIFNLSLQSGCFPQSWKQAIVQPIYKRKGDRSCPQNYRPIALLPSLSKVFETFVHNQLLQYCLNQGCLPDEQYGFLPKRSTTWQLLTIVNEWHEALDRGEAVHTLFVDIAKAFDRVDHSLLLLKLASMGVCGDQLDWFESYLRGRSISTVVDGQLSSLLSISSGVPQGSVLGPLLFVIYFRDLPSCITSASCLFADDTLLYATSPANSFCSLIQEDCERLDLWADTWNTAFNAKKSTHMVISTRRSNPPCDPVSLQGLVVPLEKSTKHLGVLLSPHLS